MKLDHHEKIFRKTLQEHHAPLDTRTLWSQIESHIESEKENRKPFYMWWIFGGLSVVTLLAVSLFLFNRTDSAPIFENEKPTSSKELITATNHVANEKTESTPLNVTSLSTNADLNINKETSLPKTVVDKTKKKITNNTNQARLNSQVEAEKLPVEPHINSLEIESTLDDVLIKEIKIEEKESRSLTDQEKSTVQSNSLSVNRRKAGSIIPTYIEPIETFAEQPATIRAKQAIATLDPRAIKNIALSEINAIELLPLASSLTSIMQDVVLHPLSIPKANKPRWSIFATAGQGNYSFKNSTTIDNSTVRPESSAIKDLRIKRQFQNLELGVDFRLSPSFSLQTGVSYTRFKSQTQFSNVYEVATSANGREDIFFVNDTLDATSGAYFEYVTVRQINETINKNLYRHYIDVPVTIAYHKNIGKRWNIGVSAGALINVKQKTDGAFLDDENRLVSSDLSSFSSNSIFKSTSDPQINYHGSAVVGYHLSPAFQIYLQPFTKYIRNFRAVESINYQTIWATGLNVGVQLSLN